MKNANGFTLIELMVAVAVLAIMLALAIPSFDDFRKRAALRGAADQVVSVIGDARFEALRVNRLVKVGMVAGAGGKFCVGAATTSDVADDDSCDCFDVTAPFDCDIARYPADQADWRKVRLLGKPEWGDDDANDEGVFVIDPKRGVIGEVGDVGGIVLASPASGPDYRLDVRVDRNGKAIVCEPFEATAHLPQFSGRTCPKKP